MQIPKVRWPLQPQGTLSVSARLYTGGARTAEETGNRAEDPAYAAHTHTHTDVLLISSSLCGTFSSPAASDNKPYLTVTSSLPFARSPLFLPTCTNG